MHQTTEPSWLSRAFLVLALATWAASLALPGYSVGHGPQLGFSILFYGLVFGWGISGYAVYANVCFVVAAVNLFRGKTPTISVALMLVFAATLPLFDREMAPDYEAPVEAWGWGMPVWLGAQALLTAAAIARAGRPRVATLVLVSAVLTGLGAVFTTRHHQLQIANAQELDSYLSHGMAFAQSPLCGIPLVWPDQPVIPEGTTFETDVDPLLLREAGLSWLPLPSYRGRGGEPGWTMYGLRGVFSGEFQVRGVPSRYVLQARSEDDGGAVIRIVDLKTHAVLYEQPLRLRSWVAKSSGGHSVSYYCPRDGNDAPATLGVKQALARALGVSMRRVDDRTPPRLPDEIGNESCPLVAAGEPSRFRLDGRDIYLSSEIAQQSAGFCSGQHVFLARFTRGGGTGPDDVPNILVLDRDSLRPVALFDDRNWCRANDRSCFDVSSDSITGVSIQAGAAVIRTRAGDRRAPFGIRLSGR